jgi:hypothetical protein
MRTWSCNAFTGVCRRVRRINQDARRRNMQGGGRARSEVLPPAFLAMPYGSQTTGSTVTRRSCRRVAVVARWQCASGLQEATSLAEIAEPEHMMVAPKLSREAETVQNIDPGYQAELQVWTTTDLRRPDGVPVSASPRTDSRYETESVFEKDRRVCMTHPPCDQLWAGGTTQPCPSDTSDEQRTLIQPLLPEVKTGGRPEKHPRPRAHHRQEWAGEQDEGTRSLGRGGWGFLGSDTAGRI